jgi:hypothetical protein
VPHISPGFGEMWEVRRFPHEIVPCLCELRGNIRHFPHLAKTGRDMGHPRPLIREYPENLVSAKIAILISDCYFQFLAFMQLDRALEIDYRLLFALL